MKSSSHPAPILSNSPDAPAGPVAHVRTARPGEMETVARVRSRCYDPSYSHLQTHLLTIADDRGQIDRGDFVLAERNKRLVGTATSLSGLMNIRGRLLPCQGVAWVGTTVDARRSGGVASAIMGHVLSLARERGEVLSSLMPFRASFYEHFGYGLCERRLIWNIPSAILPKPDLGGFELIEPDELDTSSTLDALAGCRREQVGRGHGDMLFPHAPNEGMAHWTRHFQENGYLFARRDDSGTIDAFITTEPVTEHGRRGLRCLFAVHADTSGLRAILRFLATLKDQYGFVQLAAPVDLPLNWLLRETQLPHRPVEHPHARCEVIARMQVRVLDHLALLNGMERPAARDGQAIVRIEEPEGHASSFRIEISHGHVSAASTDASPDVTLPAHTWAAVALGEMPASNAARMGLLSVDAEPALTVLDAFADGPAPFCREFF